jgi:hypothetical protein
VEADIEEHEESCSQRGENQDKEGVGDNGQAQEEYQVAQVHRVSAVTVNTLGYQPAGRVAKRDDGSPAFEAQVKTGRERPEKADGEKGGGKKNVNRPERQKIRQAPVEKKGKIDNHRGYDYPFPDDAPEDQQGFFVMVHSFILPHLSEIVVAELARRCYVGARFIEPALRFLLKEPSKLGDYNQGPEIS